MDIKLPVLGHEHQLVTGSACWHVKSRGCKKQTTHTHTLMPAFMPFETRSVPTPQLLSKKKEGQEAEAHAARSQKKRLILLVSNSLTSSHCFTQQHSHHCMILFLHPWGLTASYKLPPAFCRMPSRRNHRFSTLPKQFYVSCLAGDLWTFCPLLFVQCPPDRCANLSTQCIVLPMTWRSQCKTYPEVGLPWMIPHQLPSWCPLACPSKPEVYPPPAVKKKRAKRRKPNNHEAKKKNTLLFLHSNHLSQFHPTSHTMAPDAIIGWLPAPGQPHRDIKAAVNEGSDSCCRSSFCALHAGAFVSFSQDPWQRAVIKSDDAARADFWSEKERRKKHTHTHTHLAHNISHALFHTQLSHTHTHIFHTQLCHTHTHHLSLSHNIFHIRLCHIQFFSCRSSITSFVFPSFPVPPTRFVVHYWKKLTCGVIRSFNFVLKFNPKHHRRIDRTIYNVWHHQRSWYK